MSFIQSAARRLVQLVDPGYMIAAPTGGDDTAALQGYIDRVASHGGGKVLLCTGNHKVTGRLKPRPAVTVEGLNQQATQLTCTVPGAHLFDCTEDPDKFSLRNLNLRASGYSKAFAFRCLGFPARDLTVRDCDVNNFRGGFRFSNALNLVVDHVRFNGRGKGKADSVAAVVHGNGVRFSDCYVAHYATGLHLFSQASEVRSPILEANGTGILSDGGPLVVTAPWSGSGYSQNDVDIDVRNNGVLLLGYGSQSWRLKFAGRSERRRSIIIPGRFDRSPADGDEDRPGIWFGGTRIENLGDTNRIVENAE